jgi:hypothetical protein
MFPRGFAAPRRRSASAPLAYPGGMSPRLALIALGLAACGARATAPPPTPEVAMKPPPPAACLEQLTVDHGRSVLTEQRSLGPAAFDFQQRFAAADIDRDTQIPVAATAAFQIGQTPLLWWNAARTEAVVNAAVLSELRVVDATNLAAGSTEAVGQLSELGVGHIAGRDLVKFLIAARVIATYVHIGAELCIVDEHDGPAGYQATVTGQHTYFTNAKHVEPLAFTVTIDAAGVIAVRGD